MTKNALSEMVVLHAVVAAAAPRSNYINDQIQRMHAARIRNGGTGHSPTVALVLRRLKALAVKGFLVQSPFTDGYYGYEWTITDKGRDALLEFDQ